MTTWTIAIDWDRNGNYSDTYDNITSYVTQINWFLGMRQPYQDTADNSMLTMVLNNADRRFSPDNAASPLAGKIVPQRPVQIQSFDGTTTRTHWLGWINAIQPAVNKYGERVTKILASGAIPFFSATEVNLALQQNKRTDEVIGSLITQVVMPPALSQAWILGLVGNSEIGDTTYLADVTAFSTLEPGTLTLGIAADNWVRQGGFSDVAQDNFDVYHAISDITAAEHGKFFFSRDGKAVFWNRHHLLQGATPTATFNDTMTDMSYSYAGPDECKNEVIVVAHPRTLSGVNTDILWQLGDAVINVPINKPRTISVNYADTSKQRIGAQNVTVAGLTFASGSATVTVEARANGADLTFTNTGTAPAVVTGCTVQGQKIVDSGEMEAKSTDTSSIINYGRRTLRLNLSSIDKLDDAQYIADFERNRRANPRGTVQALTVLSSGTQPGGQQANQLALTIGDLITVTETQTAHNANYYLIGEAHELTNGANLWKTTWYLEPAPGTYPWKLGVSGRSELGTATTLTY